MAASPTILYKWADGVKVIKAIDVTAPQYVKYLNEWIEWQVRFHFFFVFLFFKISFPFPFFLFFFYLSFPFAFH